MILTYRYRLLPTKPQHRALVAILESQRQLYNAALEERIDAYRKAKVTRTYFDQDEGAHRVAARRPGGLDPARKSAACDAQTAG